MIAVVELEVVDKVRPLLPFPIPFGDLVEADLEEITPAQFGRIITLPDELVLVSALWADAVDGRLFDQIALLADAVDFGHPGFRAVPICIHLDFALCVSFFHIPARLPVLVEAIGLDLRDLCLQRLELGRESAFLSELRDLLRLSVEKRLAHLPAFSHQKSPSAYRFDD